MHSARPDPGPGLRGALPRGALTVTTIVAAVVLTVGTAPSRGPDVAGAATTAAGATAAGATDEGTTDEGTTDEGTTDEGTTDEGTTGGADGGGTLDPGRPRPAPTATPSATTSPANGAPPVATHEVLAPPSRLSAEGWLVAGGRSPVAGTTGPLVAYTVELAVARERGLDPDAVAAAVTATLAEPDHGWTSTGVWRLQRVDDPEDAYLRVLLAEPPLVDELCARAGLDTRGSFSCFNGSVAALNVERWIEGVAHVGDLGLYRTYLVNHEVGHGLGYRHETCPGADALAPLMMQLTVSTEGCRPNGDPFP